LLEDDAPERPIPMNFTRNTARALENLAKKSHDLVKIFLGLQLMQSNFNRQHRLKRNFTIAN